MQNYRALVLFILFPLICFGQRSLAFKADDHHINIGGSINYFQPYNHPVGDHQVGGGFMVVWDHATKASSALSFGAEIQTIWYDDAPSGYQLHRISPNLRIGFHPLSQKIIAGYTPVQMYLDPYIMTKIGLHFDNRTSSVVVPSFSPIVLGVRWYFSENVALWFEQDSWYSTSVGIGFWL